MSRLQFIRQCEISGREGYIQIHIHHTALIDGSAAIGVPGQGYERNEDGELERMPQLGGVRIDEGVRIAANAVVARGAWSDTVVGADSSIGFAANIGHGARVGSDCLILAHAVISGSAVIHDRVTIGVGAIVRPKVRVGQGAIVGDGAVVTKDVDDYTTVIGNPAMRVA